MDGEVMAALKNVRQARNAANLTRFDRSLSLEEQGRLTQLYLDLDDLEGKLILGDLRAQLDGLRADSAQLSAVVADMQQAGASLRSLADKVQVAATAVNAVVSVVQAAVAVAALA